MDHLEIKVKIIPIAISFRPSYSVYCLKSLWKQYLLKSMGFLTAKIFLDVTSDFNH